MQDVHLHKGQKDVADCIGHHYRVSILCEPRGLRPLRTGAGSGSAREGSIGQGRRLKALVPPCRDRHLLCELVDDPRDRP